jgi:hypothetical protein
MHVESPKNRLISSGVREMPPIRKVAIPGGFVEPL